MNFLTLPDRLAMLDHLELKGKDCIEVGVFAGDFSLEIAKRNPAHLWLIDPWIQQPKDVYPDDHSNVSSGEFKNVYEMVKNRFEGFQNVILVRDFSFYASSKYKDDSLDMVYIDAIHTYENCLCDMSIWFQKVKPDGWLCGHDYTGKFLGVRRAVESFCRITGQKIGLLTLEPWGSWGIQKKSRPQQLPQE